MTIRPAAPRRRSFAAAPRARDARHPPRRRRRTRSPRPRGTRPLRAARAGRGRCPRRRAAQRIDGIAEIRQQLPIFPAHDVGLRVGEERRRPERRGHRSLRSRSSRTDSSRHEESRSAARTTPARGRASGSRPDTRRTRRRRWRTAPPPCVRSRRRSARRR